MACIIVSTFERPDLVRLTAEWRWHAFFRDTGRSLDDVIATAQRTAAAPDLIPRTLVLLVDGEPVGTASLTARDLEERPELTPWLAGVFVAPQARRQGHAERLVRAVEQAAHDGGIATLWLYSNTAERIYARIGWQTVETVQHRGQPHALMRRDLGPR